MSDTKQVSTTQRALQVLYACAMHEHGCSFSDLRECLGGVANTTLTRILSDLAENDDLIKNEEGLYVCGSRFRQAAEALCSTQSIEDYVTPYVERVARITEQSAAFFHWDSDWIYLCAKKEMPDSFHYSSIGFRKHYESHTFFRVVQAYLSEEVLNNCKISIPEKDRALIRQQGYFDQIESMRVPFLRICAPVFKQNKEPEICGSLGITTFIQDFDKKRIAELGHIIHREAHALSQELS